MILDPTAIWLDEVITAGGLVIVIDSTADVPGALVVGTEGLGDALIAARRSRSGDLAPTPDIGFVHRRCRDAEIYVVVNTGPGPRLRLVARTSKSSYEQWDALSGRVLRAGEAKEGIELTLHPYEATVLVLSDDARLAESEHHIGAQILTSRCPLSGPWQVAYGNEPAQPVDLPHVWEDEPGRRALLGSGDVYEQHRAQ